MDDPVDAPLPESPTWRTWSGTLFVVLPIPLLLVWFMYELFQPWRVILGFIGASLGCIGLVRFTRAAMNGRRDLMSAFFVAGGLTICLTLLWNYAYLQFAPTFYNGSREVFRVNFRRHFAPIYGRLAVSTWAAALPAILLTLGIWAATWRWNPARPLRRWGLPLIMAIQFMMIAALGASDLGIVPGKGKPAGSSERISGHSIGFEPFREDAKQFRSVPQLFRLYVGRMPGLSWFGQHYPPVPAAIFVLEGRYGVVRLDQWVTPVLNGLTTTLSRLGLPVSPVGPLGDVLLGGWLTTVAVVLSTPFIYLTGRTLSDRPIVANAMTVTYVTATGGLLYPLLSVTPLVLLPGAVAVWAFVRGIKGPVAAILLGGLLGVTMVAFALASLSAAYFAAVLGLVWVGCVAGCVVGRRVRPDRRTAVENAAARAAYSGVVDASEESAARAAASSFIPVRPTVTSLLLLAIAGAGSAFGCHWLLKHEAGFDLFACGAVAVELHHKQIGTSGFDGFDAWFFRATCNLLAFLLINLPLLGLFVATLLLWKRTDWRDVGRLFCVAVTVVVLFAAGSGKFYAETERIWMLFLPAIAVVAGLELAREGRETDVRRAVALMTLFVVWQELVFVHGAT